MSRHDQLRRCAAVIEELRRNHAGAAWLQARSAPAHRFLQIPELQGIRYIGAGAITAVMSLASH